MTSVMPTTPTQGNRYPNGASVTWQAWTRHLTGNRRRETRTGFVLDYRGRYAIVRDANEAVVNVIRHDRLTAA